MDENIKASEHKPEVAVTLSQLLAAQDLQPLGCVSSPAEAESGVNRQDFAQ